jgi:hypothetical protein
MSLICINQASTALHLVDCLIQTTLKQNANSVKDYPEEDAAEATVKAAEAGIEGVNYISLSFTSF